jgi:thiosulfate/3-mercaptopyruvate sulfurtransferase
MNLKATIISNILAILVCALSLWPASEAFASDDLSPVVSTAWLAEHMSESDLVILHMGQKGTFEEGHIPGARSASLRQMIRVNEAGIRDEMLPADDMFKILSELGIDENSRIVIYFAEEGAAWAVARYLLILEYVGMTGRAAYLDGGLPKWVAEGRGVSKEASVFESTDHEFKIVPDILVDIKWLTVNYQRSGIAVIDGRPAEEFTGLAGHWDRLGHIPGAGSIPFFTLLAEDPAYLLKSKEELSIMFAEAGVNSGDTVVVYCGTGLWASLPYLAARHLDYEVRLYDGSFQEWSSTKGLPVTAQGKDEN